MKNAKYRVALPPDRVEALQALARKLAFEYGNDCSWCDLLRAGIELVLAAEPGRLLAMVNNKAKVTE